MAFLAVNGYRAEIGGRFGTRIEVPHMHFFQATRRDDLLSICEVVRARFRVAAMHDRATARTQMTPSLLRRAHLGIAHALPLENALTIRHCGTCMEHLWSLEGATGGNQ